MREGKPFCVGCFDHLHAEFCDTCGLVIGVDDGKFFYDTMYYWGVGTKDQLISKPIYDLLTSPKKRTDEFDLFALLLFTANKSNSSVRFFGRI